jgi:hypothetical protein
VEVASASLQVGDFDDNKQAEVLALGTGDFLGRAPAQVIFFSEGLERSTTQAIPGLLGNPAVGRYADSPYDGVAFSAIPGVAMLIGRRDRQFFPRSYPSFQGTKNITDGRVYFVDLGFPSIPFESNQPEVEASQRLLGFVSFEDQGQPLHTIAFLDNTTEQSLTILPRGPKDLLGDLLRGRLHEGLPCPTVVAAFQGSNDVFVFPTCKAKAGGGFEPGKGLVPSSVALLPGTVPITAPVLVDLDRDGHLDLFLWAGNKEGALPFVGYGDGAGALRKEPGGKGPPGFSLHTIPSEQASLACAARPDLEEIKKQDADLAAFLVGKALLPPLLASADLDGDTFPDFVYPFGICLSNAPASGGTPLYTLRGLPLGIRWDEALVEDFNADGLLDVAVTSSENRSLDLLLGSPSGWFNPAKVPLNGSPSMLRSGDFDGDGSVDLAFREEGVQSTSNVGSGLGDALAILFSAPKQIPTTLVRAGRFERIAYLTSGAYDTVFPDGITDLGVTVPPSAQNASLPEEERTFYNLALFPGSSDRALRSPLLLATDEPPEGEQADQARISLPMALSAGRFTDRAPASQQDLITVGVEQPDNTDECNRTCEDRVPCKKAHVRLWLSALRGDAQLRGSFPSKVLPADDLVYIPGCSEQGQLAAGDLDGDGFDEVVFAAPTASGQSKVFVGRTRGVAASPELLPPLPLALALAPGGRPVVLDVDSDGKRDALLLVRQGGASQLAVLWGKGDGTFEEAPALLALPEQSVRGLCGARAADGRQEPLLLGDTGLFRLGASRQLAATPVEQFTSEQRGGLALACGDLDGDGVDDVAISSGSLLRVFRGLPVRP